jgi:beta-glucosidase
LLDNFERQFGHTKRIGIVAVDYSMQQRSPKASAHFYSDVIRSNGVTLADRIHGTPLSVHPNFA